MKNKITRVCMLTAACTLHIQSADKRSIKVINDAGVFNKFNIILKQKQKPTDRISTTDTGSKNPLLYDFNGGPVTIEAHTMSVSHIDERNYGPIETEQMAGKELHIVKIEPSSSTEGHTFDVRLQSMPAPKKQKIRAHKKDALDAEWTVRIEDAKGNPISESTFKENTDRFAKNLYVRLNPYTVATDDRNAKYNVNTVTIVKPKLTGSESIPGLDIHVGKYDPQKHELQISKQAIQLVPKQK